MIVRNRIIELSSQRTVNHLVGRSERGSFPRDDELTLDNISYCGIAERISSGIAPLLPYSFTAGEGSFSMGYALGRSIESDVPFEICFKQIIGDLFPADSRYIPGTMNQFRGIGGSTISRDGLDVKYVWKVHEQIGALIDEQAKSLSRRTRFKQMMAWDRFVNSDLYGSPHAGPC